MFTDVKAFAFSASHQLHGLPEGHQCGRGHGHNYVVELELTGETLDAYGFVLDYGELAPFKAYIDRNLDHRHLNDVYDFQPSAELLARHLYDTAAVLLKDKIDRQPAGTRIAAVRVRETPKTCAEYRP